MSDQCTPNGRLEAHHLDYDHPLFVTWLCHRHHSRADRARRVRDPRTWPPHEVDAARAAVGHAVRHGLIVKPSVCEHREQAWLDARLDAAWHAESSMVEGEPPTKHLRFMRVPLPPTPKNTPHPPANARQPPG